MKALCNALIVTCILGFVPSFDVQAQGILKEELLKNHEGSVPTSINYPKEVLKYKWDYQSSRQKVIEYKLELYHNNEKINTFDVLIRNLTNSLYIDIRFYYQEERRTLTAIYKKTHKWLRIKGVFHPDCKRDDTSWLRVEEIDNLETLLEQIIVQIDQNVNLACFQR